MHTTEYIIRHKFSSRLYKWIICNDNGLFDLTIFYGTIKNDNQLFGLNYYCHEHTYYIERKEPSGLHEKIKLNFLQIAMLPDPLMEAIRYVAKTRKAMLTPKF